MSNSKTDDLQKARNYAFLLLKFRPRSEKEICERLKRKRFDAGVIRLTLGFLKEKNFINDSDFSRSWVESRLSKRLGAKRIRQELRLKGIDKEVIESQLGEFKDSFPEDKIVRDIAREKMKRFSNIEPQKAKRRIYGYLMRRGFSAGIIMDILRQL